MKDAITLYLTKENDAYTLSAFYDVTDPESTKDLVDWNRTEDLGTSPDLSSLGKSARTMAKQERSPIFILAEEGLDSERNALERAVGNC